MKCLLGMVVSGMLVACAGQVPQHPLGEAVAEVLPDSSDGQAMEDVRWMVKYIVRDDNQNCIADTCETKEG